MNTTLGTIQWQEFTRQYWHAEPVRLEYAPRGAGGPILRAVVYRDRKGRFFLPPYQPHLPLEFRPTATDAPYRLQRQWLETARLLVDDMQAAGICGELTFSPDVVDPRPWQWAHFRVTARTTNFIDFPFDIHQADRIVRQQANKARKAGFDCRRTDDMRHVMACLSGSQTRKGFDYGMTVEGLEMARDLLGTEAFRVYICYAANGQPASARVALHRAGGRACDWLAGTRAEYLPTGATQLLLGHMLDDLEQAGAIGYNSCGADIEPVALAKACWGGRLMTQFSLLGYDFHPMKRFLGDAVRYFRRRVRLRRERAAGPAARPSSEDVRDGTEKSPASETATVDG